MSMKGKSNVVWLIVGILAIGGIAYYLTNGFTNINLPKIGPTTAAVTQSGQTAVTASGVFSCPSGRATTVETSVRNPDSTTTLYLNSPVAVADASGKVIATGTATQGTTLAYASITVPCSSSVVNQGVTVYPTESASFASGAPIHVDYQGSINPTAALLARNATAPTLRILTTDFVNASTGADSATITSHQTTMGTDASNSTLVRVFSPASPGQFGGDGAIGTVGGVYVSIDTVNSTTFQNPDITLADNSGGRFQLQSVACSARANDFRSANNCYVMRPISASTIGAQADLLVSWRTRSDPQGSTSDFVVYFDDIGCFVEADNTISCDIANRGLQNQGIGAVSATFDLA